MKTFQATIRVQVPDSVTPERFEYDVKQLLNHVGTHPIPRQSHFATAVLGAIGHAWHCIFCGPVSEL